MHRWIKPENYNTILIKEDFMTVDTFFKSFQINCPSCRGNLDVIKNVQTENAGLSLNGIVNEKTTITPIFRCSQCGKEYTASFELRERLNEIKISISCN
jgi:uncharacterized Zn finger protein